MFPPFRDDVVCIGSATVDRFLEISVPFSSLHLGDKILIGKSEIHSGGGASNSAAALSLMGLKTKMIAKLGQDHDAQFVQEEMRKYKIANLCRARSTAATDSSTIISSTKEKDRIIFAYKGASKELSAHDFHFSSINAKWVYLATVMGKSLDTAKTIVSYAQKRKVKILFNPSLYLAKMGASKLKPFLRAAAILILNNEEAQALLRTREVETAKMLSKLHRLGPPTVVITDGPRRMMALHQGKMYSLFPPRVNVVHTAGAGDAFSSGLLAGMIKGWSFENSLRLGQINASSVIQHLGTKNKLLTEKEALSLMKRYSIKVAAGDYC